MFSTKIDKNLNAREYLDRRLHVIAEIILMIVTLASVAGGLAMIVFFGNFTSGIAFLFATAAGLVSWIIVRRGRVKVGIGIIIAFVELLDFAMLWLYMGRPEFGYVTYTFLLAGLLLSIIGTILIHHTFGLVAGCISLTAWVGSTFLLADPNLFARIPTTFFFLAGILTFNFLSGRINTVILEKSVEESQAQARLSTELSKVIQQIAELGARSDEIRSAVATNLKAITDTMQYYFEQVESLGDASEQMNGGMESVTTDLERLLGTTEEIHRETENQNALIEQNAAAQNEVVASIDSITENIKKANSINEQLWKNAEDGKEKLAVVNTSVHDMEGYQSSIGDIVSTISNVAAQTNLLAMNASIEAAHAGQAGRGFAVVADEIRNLADMTNAQVKEIKNMINEMSTLISETTAATEDSSRQMRNIMDDVSQAVPLIQEIATAMQEQSQVNQDMIRSTQSLVDISMTIREKSDTERTIADNYRTVFDSFAQSLDRVSRSVQDLTNRNEESRSVLATIEKIQVENREIAEAIGALLSRVDQGET